MALAQDLRARLLSARAALHARPRPEMPRKGQRPALTSDPVEVVETAEGTDHAALHGASTAGKGKPSEAEPVMFGRLLVLCVSCLLSAAASAQRLPEPQKAIPAPVPELPPEKATQWYALLWPEAGGCIARVVQEEDRNSFIYRGRTTKTLGPYKARSQVLAELKKMGWERQNSNDDNSWVGKSGCYQTSAPAAR